MVDETVAAPAASSEPAADLTTDPGVVEKPVTEKPISEKPATTEAAAAVDVEADESGEGEETPAKRLSRSQRQSRKIALLAQENAELRRLAEQGRRPQADERQPEPAADEPKPPKESDFNGDYLAYSEALADYRAGKSASDAVRREMAQAREFEKRQRQAETIREAVIAHEDRVDEAKERIPDFDKVIRSGGQVQIASEVAEEILKSEKSALLQYHLAQKPEKLRELNSLSGKDLAREIGRLESRLHLPKAKTATEASPPLTDVKGGAAAAFDPHKTDDMDAFSKWLNEDLAKRRRA